MEKMEITASLPSPLAPISEQEKLVWTTTGPVPIWCRSICPQFKREPKLPIDLVWACHVADSSTACMARGRYQP